MLATFHVSTTFADIDVLSTDSANARIIFVKPCLPQFEIENKLNWEEKEESGVTYGESKFKISPPLNPDGFEFALPKNSGFKRFSIEINLFGGDHLKCKFDPSKPLKIDMKEFMDLHRTRKCDCVQ